jgi:hypothetical protein
MNKLNHKLKFINKYIIPKNNHILYDYKLINKFKTDNKYDHYLNKFNDNNYNLNNKNINYNKKYYHTTSLEKYKLLSNKNIPYKYNFIFGGICGIILVELYTIYFIDEENSEKIVTLYPSNFMINILDKSYEYHMIGFVIGGLIFPISYSLVSASIVFSCMKKLL